ncbi:FixH family protein [Metabacillus lacus]|uniref:FixH family protein n=1 Tax=Metabacillus lacus TaxID=1983721 RepID=UPI0014792075|nr:FixH family protein [Metabacillus lacus]
MNRGRIFLFCCMLLLTGCTASQQQEDTLTAIEVVIALPDSINTDEKTKISAAVTQGNEKVEDANEVEFEIWAAGSKEDSYLVEGNHEGNGIYSGDAFFSAEGVYYIQAHVTARNMHSMPKVKAAVGTIDPEEWERAGEEEQQQKTEEASSHH